MQGGRCLRAVLGIFVYGSRLWRVERTKTGREENGVERVAGTAERRRRVGEKEAGKAEIARREATDVRVNAITLHLCSKLS